jgi:hypothetical protein
VAKTAPFACQAVLRYETVMITLDRKNMSNKLALFFFCVKLKETVAISTAHVFEWHEAFFFF